MVEREVRGIPLWLIREYLEELGGVAQDDTTVAGTGWIVRLEQIEDFRIGSLAIGQVRLRLEGEIAELNLQLDDKLLRAGG